MLIVAAMLAAAVQVDQATELTNPADIAVAGSVEDALNALVKEAGSCKSQGMACACSLKPGLRRLSAAYHSAIRLHPSWNDAAVQYVKRANGRSLTTAIMFPAVRRQLEMCHVP